MLGLDFEHLRFVDDLVRKVGRRGVMKDYSFLLSDSVGFVDVPKYVQLWLDFHHFLEQLGASRVNFRDIEVENTVGGAVGD